MGRFNLIQPSLIQQLKTILDQYQDDGQILKELIQNAEDAGASHVKFLYDEHSYAGDPAKMHHPDLLAFQGPALYAYNDAMFTDDDWVGLKMLSDSVKKNDPMKVGRFGLGFKSVFHMTDIPTVLSGNKIGVIDPHEKYFQEDGHRTTGYMWHLREDKEEIRKIPDQFAPFRGIFDCSQRTFDTGSYKGTLFRFPLRQTASKLCDTLYSGDKVDGLFMCFQRIAHFIPLFLSSVETVEVYERLANDKEPRLRFSVSIAKKCLSQVRSRRREFLEKFAKRKKSETVTMIYPITIETVLYEKKSKSSSTETYIVNHCVKDGKFSEEMKDILFNSDVTFTPRVGVAVRVPEEKREHVSHEEPQGHVFCFLPLPLHKRSQTGLPCHVNGFFAVSQNRQFLKWPTTDQGAEKLVLDKACIWNQCVLREIVPDVYADLLLKVISWIKEGTQQTISHMQFYEMIPDISEVDEKWKIMLKPFFEQLLSKSILFSPLKKGQWLKVDSVVIDASPEDQSFMRKVVIETLLSAIENVAVIPKHIESAINLYWGQGYKRVTPALVREKLKTFSKFKQYGWREKFTLLHYCLLDEDYSNIEGLELLPLADGTFAKFSKNERPVYLASEKHTMSLLPGLERYFLDDSLETAIYDRITCLDCMESTQIREFDRDSLVKLMPEMYPKEWAGKQVAFWTPEIKGDHPPLDWLETFWTYAKENFSECLTRLEDFHLVPYTRDGKRRITRLKTDSPKILRITEGAIIEPEIAEILRNLGAIVVESLPDYLKEISSLLHEYILPPSVASVLTVLERLAESTNIDHLNDTLLCKIDPNGRKALRKFLSRATQGDLTEGTINVLKSLSLFVTVPTTSKPQQFSRLKDICIGAPREVKVLPSGVNLIDVSEPDANALLELLDGRLLTMAKYYKEIVFPVIKTGDVLGEEEVSKTLLKVLSNFSQYQQEDPDFGEHMRDIAFVQRNDGKIVCSNEVFDPDNSILQALFKEEEVFPNADFCKPQILISLRSIGLKSLDDISATDVLTTAVRIQAMASKARSQKSLFAAVVEKSTALGGVLCNKVNLLDENVDARCLRDRLCDISWVVKEDVPPSGYPKSLKWYKGDIQTEKPVAIKSDSYASIVGSVLPVIANKTFEHLHSTFGWDTQPDVSDIIGHLKNVVESYSSNEKAAFMVIVGDIYDALAQMDKNLVAKILSDDAFRWIWHGDGFALTEDVVIQPAFIDLRPYLYSLPPESESNVELFQASGVHEYLKLETNVRILQSIKHKYDSSRLKHPKDEVSRDLHIASSIVNKLGTEADELMSDTLERLLLPVHIESDTRLELALIADCTYCDAEWLKERHHGAGESQVLFVHQAIPNQVAENLGVPSLMSRMLDTDAFEIGESFGQSEPLTTRLHRLLEDYKDGFAVPKELIQNADDAGATEVRFLYDERANEDYLTCLIDEGMRECQGPALWVYNNGVFTDTDFENIIKLSGATKEKETEKIGGFGLGFNAVYNLTDVPSFLSRHYLVIFDPHMYHLGKGISDATKPGIKIDMVKNKRCLTSLGNQFRPFQGVFGCNVQLRTTDVSASFDGTLFRFPLRTKEQALKSDISSLYYDKKNVVELLEILARGIDSLLLFTQNVVKVSAFHLSARSRNPQDAQLLFSATKSPFSILKRHNIPVSLSDVIRKLPEDQQEFHRQCNTLKACSGLLKHQGTLNEGMLTAECSVILHMSTMATASCKDFFHSNVVNVGKQLWLVSSVMGDGKTLEMVQHDDALIPAAGVAVRVFQGSGGKIFLESGRTGGRLSACGSVFCFLPLPISSGVAVHVNGAFAVTSNRRQICQRLRDDKRDYKADWNEALIEDAVSKAFVSLLCDLKAIADESEYYFHSLWPVSHSDLISKLIVQSFYRKVCSEELNLEVFKHEGNWVSVRDSVFLHPDLSNAAIAENVLAVLNLVLNSTGLVAINIPPGYYDVMGESCDSGLLFSKTYSAERFYSEIFFPNLSKVTADMRDTLVKFALDDASHSLDDLLKSYACVPVTPDGEKLKLIRELINPHGKVANMYSEVDGRFPFNESFSTPERLLRLVNLGMQSDDITNEDFLERAQSIETCSTQDMNASSLRCKALLKLLDRRLRENSDLSDISDSLAETKFLPTMRKPPSMPLKWAGWNYTPTISPNDAYSPELMYLACCSRPIVDLEPSILTDSVRSFLRLDGKIVSIEETMEQIRCAQLSLAETSVENYPEIKRTCSTVYKFLQDFCLHNPSSTPAIVEQMTNCESVFVDNRFVFPHKTALSSPSDCSPYLNELPYEFQTFEFLLKAAGVKSHFEISDFVETLATIETRFREKRLQNKEREVVINISRHLSKAVETSPHDFEAIQERHGTIFLLSSDGFMVPSTELCFNDCPWLPDDSTMTFVHQSIPYADAKALGVNTKRQDSLKRNSIGIPFGQKERLTKRLKRILTGYPCGKEVLKELLQNADDAKATKIHFVKDFRYHGTKKIFEDCWKPLQGPALCVYNDSSFTKIDLEGIQNLGEGSKGEDPTKTGQYGVGFNAVYHLTDVPSFISMGEEIGEVLCAFDPHCTYVPGATPSSPGRMFANLSDMKHVFTDVFDSYLQDLFDLENATMFRFPLRDRQMASESNISNTHVSQEVIDKLLQTFKTELFDIMLFLNSVEQISISSTDLRTGKLTETYTVKLELSSEDKANKQHFQEHVMREIDSVKQKRKSLFEINKIEKSYTVSVRDSEKHLEKWLVTQRFGFDSGTAQTTVRMAINSGDLSLLPRGGVASLLGTSGFSRTRQNRPFCFLPLPVNMELPVHINGHFALDHEARRNLWRDENGGYRTDWNMTLLGNVIAPCYVKHLETFRALELDSPMTKNKLILSRSYEDITLSLRNFHSLFPPKDIYDDYWRYLAERFYHVLHHSRCRLFPVVRLMKSSEVQLKWFAAKGRGDDIGFFNNIESSLREQRNMSEDHSEIIKNVLIATGCNILDSPVFVLENFLRLNLEVKVMTPTFARMFFKTHKSLTPLCDLPTLPVALVETPFEDSKRLKVVLQYCLMDDDFIENLHGLPLLLCQDNKLYHFDASRSAILSPDFDLLPDCEDKFIHSELHDVLVPEVVARSRCFTVMDIKVFGDLLSQSTFESVDFGKETHFRWFPGSGKFPAVEWIQKVWTFLYNQLTVIIEDTDGDDDAKRNEIKQKLTSLGDWNLLPAKTRMEQRTPGKYGKDEYECWLVPNSVASSVIYFNYNDVVSHPLQSALSKLGLLELDAGILEKNRTGGIRTSGSSDLSKYITASLSKPIAVLATLGSTMSIRNIDGVLKPKEAIVILKYFNDSIEEGHCTSGTAAQVLMSLPFYLTVSNELISLAGCTVFVLPPHVPSSEMDVWKDKSSIVFLQRNESLKALYEHLGCSELTDTQLYTNLVFEHLEYMSDEARLIHIRYIRESSLKSATDEEKFILLSALRHLKFIPDVTGHLRTASEFCDPENEIFAAMKSPESFPPHPYNEFRWIRFLRLFGLVHEVTLDDFVNFAKEIENDAVQNPSDQSLRHKSKILVLELFKRYDVVTEGLLDQIKDIKFIAPSRVDSKWTNIYPQFGNGEGDALPFIAFNEAVSHQKEYEQVVWTSANLLPQWADPLSLKEGVLSFDPDTYNSLEDYQMAIVYNLSIREQPSVVQIVEHLSNICCHIHELLLERALDGQRHRNVYSVMNAILSFLKANVNENEETIQALSETAFIISEDGRRLMKPCQLVINLYEEQQIKPYLFRAPPELAEFFPLFETLGATTRATFRQYAMVLQGLHDHCNESKLQPNELKAAYKAVNGLFSSLDMHCDNLQEVQVLYLPSEKAFLLPSSDLVYNDEPSFTPRLVGFDKQFLVNLKECNLKAVFYGDLLKKLPKRLQCQMLSALVTECLDSSCLEQRASYGTSQLLRNRLTSPLFGDSVIRLIRHEHQGQKISSKRLNTIKHQLKNVRVFGLETVKTFLKYNGVKIDGSESSSDCFVKKIKENDEKIWCIYIMDSSEMTLNAGLQVHVAEVVARMTRGLLQEAIIYISPILTCPAQQIAEALDKLRVRQDHSTSHQQPTLAPPGEFIPIEDHHLLKEDLAAFEQDEYVGYELNDPTVQDNVAGDATFVYAIILDIVDCESENPFMWLYRINVGDDRPAIVVPATDLYGFHRLETVARDSSAIFKRSHSFNEQIIDDAEDFTGEEMSEEEEVEDTDEILDESTQETRYENQWHTPPDSPTRERYRSRTSSHLNDEQPFDFENTTSFSRQSSRVDPGMAYREERETSSESFYEDASELPHENNTNTDQQDHSDGPNFEEFRTAGQKTAKEQLDEIRERLRQHYEEQKRGQKPSADRRATNVNVTEPETKPENFEKIKKYITHVLGNAYEMDEKEKKKILKRIMLKWHPDKNYDQIELATKVMQHIQSEIGRLDQGGFRADGETDPAAWWAEFARRRAEMHNNFRSRYQQNFYDTFADSHERYSYQDFNVPPSFCKRNPQPGEARRWYRQARYDLQAADNDLISTSPATEWSCLKCYQAAEKALRAGMLTIDSQKFSVVNLRLMAFDFDDVRLRNDCSSLQEIIGDSSKLCYPDNATFPDLPRDTISEETARDVLVMANRVVETIAGIMADNGVKVET